MTDDFSKGRASVEVSRIGYEKQATLDAETALEFRRQFDELIRPAIKEGYSYEFNHSRIDWADKVLARVKIFIPEKFGLSSSTSNPKRYTEIKFYCVDPLRIQLNTTSSDTIVDSWIYDSQQLFDKEAWLDLEPHQFMQVFGRVHQSKLDLEKKRTMRTPDVSSAKPLKSKKGFFSGLFR